MRTKGEKTKLPELEISIPLTVQAQAYSCCLYGLKINNPDFTHDSDPTLPGFFPGSKVSLQEPTSTSDHFEGGNEISSCIFFFVQCCQQKNIWSTKVLVYESINTK